MIARSVSENHNQLRVSGCRSKHGIQLDIFRLFIVKQCSDAVLFLINPYRQAGFRQRSDQGELACRGNPVGIGYTPVAGGSQSKAGNNCWSGGIHRPCLRCRAGTVIFGIIGDLGQIHDQLILTIGQSGGNAGYDDVIFFNLN